MDKRKVIHAYRRGFITLQECAQVLGLSPAQITGMVTELSEDDQKATHIKHTVHR